MDKKAEKHVMLSYSWNDKKDLVTKIKIELVRRGFKTWMDIDEMRGNINSAMAEGVEGAFAVLMCVGKNYMKSQNCEKEAGYADSKKKPILTVIVEKGICLAGWAGVINGSRLYYDFSDPTNFVSKMNEIEKELKLIQGGICGDDRSEKTDLEFQPRRLSKRRLSERERLEKLRQQFGDLELQG